MAQAQAQPGMMARAVGNIEAFFKKPQDLSKIPGSQQQNQEDFQGNQQTTGTQQEQQRQQQQPSGGTAKGATNDAETLQNPLDVYANLFDNKPTLDKDGKPVAGPPQPPKFTLDRKTIKEASATLDFTADMPEELAAKLQSGEALAGQDVVALMQHAGRSAYSMAMEHGSTLTDRFVESRFGHEQQGLDKNVNRILARNQSINNPAIQNNPVLKEHYQSISDRISSKFPDQPAEWVAQQTAQYFTDMAKAVNPKLREDDGESSQQIDASGGTMKDGKVFDWQAYLK